MPHSVRAALAVACILPLLACDDDNGPGGTEAFDAALSAAAEVPPTGVAATGTATFTVTGATLSWTVAVVGIDSVTGAHIHAGAAGENGGIMVDLEPTATGLGFTGTLATGSATVADSVLTRMRNGTAYVNVHTKTNPGGAIRGQIAAQ